MKRLAIIHTIPATIPTLGALAAKVYPDVQVSNFLDDSILPDINAAGGITPAVRARFYLLAQAAQAAGSQAVLCACSSIGQLLEESRDFLTVPAFRIDEPMAQTAVETGENIAVVATLASTLAPTSAIIEAKAKAAGKNINIRQYLLSEAGQLMREGKMEEYTAFIVKNLEAAAKENSVIVLAQASMAGAAAKFDKPEGCVILSSPESGMAALGKVFCK